MNMPTGGVSKRQHHDDLTGKSAPTKERKGIRPTQNININQQACSQTYGQRPRTSMPKIDRMKQATIKKERIHEMEKT